MSTYGQQTLATTGYPLMAIAENPANIDWKVGGVSIDWGTVAAVSADTTVPDGTVVKNGQKYLRYGQVVTRTGVSEVQTATWTGGPTAGGAILTLPAAGNEPAQSTSSIAFNATAAAFEAALTALSRISVGGVAVTRTGAGSAGDPYVYTITFARRLGDVPQFTSTHTFTGGTTPTATHATSTTGAGDGRYGPYDPAASDGRQTLSRGDCWVVNETVTENPPLGFGASASDHPAVFDGGTVYRERLLVTAAATGTLAIGPTLANFETAFPRIAYATS